MHTKKLGKKGRTTDRWEELNKEIKKDRNTTERNSEGRKERKNNITKEMTARKKEKTNERTRENRARTQIHKDRKK